jgi:hypothetical protein
VLQEGSLPFDSAEEAPEVARALCHVTVQVIAQSAVVRHGGLQEPLHPPRALLARVLAIVQQFARGSPASRPATNAVARRRGSTRPNRARS